MKLIRGLAVCVLLVCGTLSIHAQAKPTAGKPVATVNGEAITWAEFESALRRVPAPPAEFNETQRKALQLEVVGVMIDEVLLRQFLKKQVPPPNAALVQSRVNELQNALQSRGRTLQDYLEENGQTEAGLKAEITAVIQWNAYVKNRITDEEARKYYERNRELFDGTLIRVSHIALAAPNGDTKTQQAALKKLQGVKEELARGVDFAEAAKKHSEDPTARNGGDLGYFPPNSNEPDPFVRTASALQVGQVSDVVRSEYGYHLIKVTDRKPGKPTTFEESKDDARLLCADELRQQIIADQRKAAKVQINLP